MRPKKREKEKDTPQERPCESAAGDRELFLQAFEKPTQIYRYLRSRNIVSPTFLHRNLHYMQERRSYKGRRKDFVINKLLDKVEAKQKQRSHYDRYKSQFMNLKFTGFFDKQVDAETVEVEAILLKICHKKRKDVSSPMMRVCLGKVQVPVNPDFPGSPTTRTISISHDYFNQNSSHSVRSYGLVITATCTASQSIPNGVCNGDIFDPEEPPHKKRKNGKTSAFDDEQSIYGTELVIYDRHHRCQLTDGEYEVAMESVETISKKPATWETVVDDKLVGPFDVFSKCPSLKFSLKWTEVAADMESKDLFTAGYKDINDNGYSNHVIKNNSGSKNDSQIELQENNQTTPRKKMRIFYQFLYSNNTGQQTEARDDLHCPWCALNCMQLYSLLKHLRLCHPRFNFIYVPHHKGARIDVSINERYDGSYVGNPQDLHSHVGYAFSRNGPIRRTPVTHVIVYRPKRPTPYLSEFFEQETENQINRQLVQGHNRLYYHTVTCQPVKPQEISVDSEDESYPEWLQQKTINMIDEFTDVNEGEKELMKLWNLHIMKYNYMGDCQIPTACTTFVDEHGKEILEKNLSLNFLLHVVNLFDFSLIKPEVVQKSMGLLEALKDRCTESKKMPSMDTMKVRSREITPIKHDI